ncbi:cell division protein SepF [Emergencia sp.]|uniref:cell division protein SepF n=1 Tax=Emergencia sp. TaxID=1926557 RepID=UPI003AF1823B
MGFAESIKKVIGIEELDDDEMITEEEVNAAKEKIAKEPRRSYASDTVTTEKKAKAPMSSSSSKTSEKRFSVTNTSAFKLVLIEPKAFEECPKLVDSLKGRRPVIINLEKLETEVARKIFDFMSGATYALNGNVQKVANNIFIFAPENVGISTSQDERTAFDFSSDEKSPWR